MDVDPRLLIGSDFRPLLNVKSRIPLSGDDFLPRFSSWISATAVMCGRAIPGRTPRTRRRATPTSLTSSRSWRSPSTSGIYLNKACWKIPQWTVGQRYLWLDYCEWRQKSQIQLKGWLDKFIPENSDTQVKVIWDIVSHSHRTFYHLISYTSFICLCRSWFGC